MPAITIDSIKAAARELTLTQWLAAGAASLVTYKWAKGKFFRPKNVSFLLLLCMKTARLTCALVW